MSRLQVNSITCSECHTVMPAYKVRRAKSEMVCDACSTRGDRRRASQKNQRLDVLNPPLTPKLKNALDKYVCEIIDSGGYASLHTEHKLFRDMTRDRARDALMVYSNISQEWCEITHGERNGRHYHFMNYRKPRDKPAYRLFDPADFDVIDRFISERSKPLVVNREDIASLKTETPKQWLLFRTYFGLRPEHKVLWRGPLNSEKVYDIYLIGEHGDEVLDKNTGYQLVNKLIFTGEEEYGFNSRRTVRRGSAGMKPECIRSKA